MIEALNARLPEGSTAQLEVILLAAAISFARMNACLSVLRKRVSGLRVFALNSRAECYPEIPPIYDKSLLYIVSSLCENDQNADKPLVGMEHYWCGYWSGTLPYIRDPDIRAVINFIGKKKSGHRRRMHRLDGARGLLLRDRGTANSLRNLVPEPASARSSKTALDRIDLVRSVCSRARVVWPRARRSGRSHQLRRQSGFVLPPRGLLRRQNLEGATNRVTCRWHFRLGLSC
jgi:hypothetical protein